MQTTKTPGRLSSAIKIVALVLIAVLADALIGYALCPFVSISELTWSDYRASASKDIDTIIIGSSFALLDLDPHTIDEQLESDTYCLGTLGQTMPDSLAALMTAKQDHDVKRVVFCLGPATLRDSPQYDREICFMQAKSAGESLPQAAQNAARVAFDENNFSSSKSIAWMFPWVYNHVNLNLQTISANLGDRLSGKTPSQISTGDDSGWRYVGAGHGSYDKFESFESIGISTSAIPSTAPFDKKHVQEFERLLDACAQQDVLTYVVVAPLPSYANLAQQNKKYPKLMKQLRDIAQNHGASYIDMNMAKPEFYRAAREDFFDRQHLNLQGAERASDALAKLIKKSEGGEDTSGLFFSYDDWNTYLDSYDAIEICMCDYQVEGDVLHVTASAVSRPGVLVEYQFESAPNGEGEFEIVQPYGKESKADVRIGGHGTMEIRVRARVAGSKEEQDTHMFNALITC